MKSLLLNQNQGEEWDIKLDGGQIFTIEGSDYITQKVKQILLTVRGEWFTDTQVGIPYFTAILVKNPQLPNIKIILQTAIKNNTILQQIGVVDAKITSMVLSSLTRKLSVKMSITTATQTIQTGFSL